MIRIDVAKLEYLPRARSCVTIKPRNRSGLTKRMMVAAEALGMVFGWRLSDLQ